MTIQYLAGIVDGEGHFYRVRNKNGQGRSFIQSRLIIINTHVPLLEEITRVFGGNFSLIKTRNDLGKKPCYRWTISGTKCEALARKLRPYLIVKVDQVRPLLANKKEL